MHRGATSSSTGAYVVFTSYVPYCFVRNCVDLRKIGVSVYSFALSARHMSTAAAPSSGAQNM